MKFNLEKKEVKMFKPFPFYIYKSLKYKLDLLVKQLDKKDVWIIIDGDEGAGKSNMATYLMYYFHCATGREFTLNNFFFNAEDLFEYAKNNQNKIVNWDEAGLGGLATEWWSEAQLNLIKFALTGRKKHHVMILCVPRFDKLKDDLRVDRTHALIHMDCGRLNNRYGNYMYLTRRGKKKLNYLWKTKHYRAYNECRKVGGHLGWVPLVLPELINEDEYDKKKDDAIASIGKKKENIEKIKLNEIKMKIGGLKTPINTREELARALSIPRTTFQGWTEMHNRSVGERTHLGATPEGDLKIL